jgi:predicted nucleic acid-binding protein
MIESSAVLDASFALRFVLPGAGTARYVEVIDRLRQDGVRLVAPDIWQYETTSGLCKAVHFETVKPSEVDSLLHSLWLIGIDQVTPDEGQCQMATNWTIRLRRAAAYDSFYLALAESLKCDLWTADRRLFNAVNLPWVRFVGENGEESREAATRRHDG